VTTGPISESGSSPGPTFICRVRSGELAGERVRDIADRHDDRDRHTALAGRAEGGGCELGGGVVEVGVGQHDGVVLGAAERLDALTALGRPGVDVPRDRGGADERDRVDAGVLEQRVDRHLVTVDDIEHAGRQAGPPVQLGDQVRGRRVALGRLQHECVAGRDRHRVHPHRNHRREVERGDPGAHAERLPERVGVDAIRDLLGELALQKLREPAHELHDLEPALDLAPGVLDDLAVL
jgi:hypothetical protein